MENKIISKESALVQIVLAFVAICVISALIGAVITNGQEVGGMGVVGLLVWVYLANRIWSHTDPEKLKKFKSQKPINLWFVLAMIPMVALIGFMAWIAFKG